MSRPAPHQASLVLNVILAIVVALLAFRVTARLPGASASDVTAIAPASEWSPATPVAAAGSVAQASPAGVVPRYDQIDSPADRRRAIIDRLRALGVPNEVLGRVARVDFEVEWDSRFEAHWGDMARMAAVQLEMNLSKDVEMRAALGEEDFKRWDQDYMLWEAMSTKVEVTGPEGEALYGYKKTLQQRMLELDKARLDGSMDEAEINDAINAAYEGFNERMRALLGDERYAKSQQIDEAFVADNFRHQLAKANPSDAQFKELFAVETQWNRARMEVETEFQNNTFSPDYVAKLRALDAARDEQFQRVLGAEAFQTLQKHQDPAYTQMKKFETLWGLDQEKIDYVYQAMKQYQKTVDDYQLHVLALQAEGRPIDSVAVQKNLQQSAEQTKRALQNYLGPERFERLQGNRVLRWATLAAQNGPRPTP